MMVPSALHSWPIVTGLGAVALYTPWYEGLRSACANWGRLVGSMEEINRKWLGIATRRLEETLATLQKSHDEHVHRAKQSPPPAAPPDHGN